MKDGKLTQLTADTAAQVAARLTEAVVRLETSSGHGVDNPRAFVLDTSKQYLGELTGHRHHAATIEQILDHQA